MLKVVIMVMVIMVMRVMTATLDGNDDGFEDQLIMRSLALYIVP